MIPDWGYLIGSALCFLALAVMQVRECNRKRDNFRDVEAERVARENAYPLGNALRVPRGRGGA